MDAVSYAHSAKQAQRIKKIINDPDSESGIVTTPKVIQSGETITIPTGRMAVLPDLTIEGDLILEGTGDVFIPSGSTLTGTVTLDTAQTITEVKTFTKSPKVPDAVASDEAIAKGQLDSALSSLVSIPTGFIIANPSTSIPDGFLECNGASLSKTTYANLFAVIGTNYGGDSTTFKLPDLRGEFIRGWDHGRGVDSGRSLGSSQTDSLQYHKHYRNIRNEQESFYNAVGSGYDDAYGGSLSTRYEEAITGDVVADGVRLANETRPRNIAMIYCIKY